MNQDTIHYYIFGLMILVSLVWILPLWIELFVLLIIGWCIILCTRFIITSLKE